MKSLWFKQRYVEPILAGEKRDTIRRVSSRLPVAGETVRLTVGPRPHFAVAVVMLRKPIDWDAVAPERAEALESFGFKYGDPLIQLIFSVVQ